MITPEQALLVVERIAGEMGESFRATPEQLKEAIDLIYRVAHCAHPEHSCHYVHNDWREEAEKIYVEIHDRPLYEELDKDDSALP